MTKSDKIILAISLAIVASISLYMYETCEFRGIAYARCTQR